MAETDIDIEVNLDQFQKLADNLAKNINPERILDEASALILSRIRRRFLAETAPDGTKWKPSLAATNRRKKGNTGTLFNTGRLFRSIQSAATGPNERSIFTDVEYAPYHQFGTSRLPQRKFLGVSNEDVDLVQRLIIKRIKDSI